LILYAGDQTKYAFIVCGNGRGHRDAITIGYRHQFSFRRFVGPTEQVYRRQQGTEVMNKINLENSNVTYQATPRFSFSASVPLLLASRRSNNSPYTTATQGIGDSILTAQGWLWNPRVMNRVDSFNGKGPQDVVLDYSIQPGSGGYGIVFQWQAFKNLPNATQLYFNGTYIATPQNTNGVLRSATAASNPLTAYNSISDQYLLEAGVAHALKRVPGLTLTFGPRWEGVPAGDLIGDSLGFRRPGFAVSLMPGMQYSHGKSLFTAGVGKAIYRDRTRSVPDKMTGGHGDAAFADYIWLASYSVRFGGRNESGPSAATHKSEPLGLAAAR